MRKPVKHDFPVSDARRYLEPGPVVLVSSRHKGKDNIMTLGWHMILEFSPSLWGAMVSSGNHSHRMIRQSGECVVNLPTAPLAEIVSRIGNCSGANMEKFAEFGLTKIECDAVDAPGIAECHGIFECKLRDDALADKYNLLIFEIVKARVAARPAHPKTLHYTGGGRFMTAGRMIDRSDLFTKVS